MQKVRETLDRINGLDTEAMREARARQDCLTKPRGSLGRLEDLAVQIAGITGNARPAVDKKRIVLFAGDHGVTREGVSAYPAEVTAQMVGNFLSGGAAINALSGAAGAEVEVVDVGVNYDFEGVAGLVSRKVARGTRNIAAGPAMTESQVAQALKAGIERAEEAFKHGVNLIGTGDMGIGNTTSSSALYSAYLEEPAENVTGLGAGIDRASLARKVKVVEKALDCNRDHLSDPLHTLMALGGFETAGICGLIIGAAALRMPVVVDGFISSAAALAAIRMKPRLQEHLIFGHASVEPGHRMFFDRLGITPVLSLDMRLGEGTGAALAMMIIDAAVRAHNDMATFEAAGVSGKSA